MKLYGKSGNIIKPDVPPPGPQEYIEKGFPPYENPTNWWQKIHNFILCIKREG